MHNPNLEARAKSIASKAGYIPLKVNTTIKINQELDVSKSSEGISKKPSKKVPRSKRK